jgi:hypothetical protein
VAAATVSAESAEEDPAQEEDPQRLPESDRMDAED